MIEPRHLSVDHIKAVEQVYWGVKAQDAEELGTDFNSVLRCSHPETQPKESRNKNIKPPKSGQRIILTANKGVAMVGMDKQDYINKTMSLRTYQHIQTINYRSHKQTQGQTH